MHDSEVTTPAGKLKSRYRPADRPSGLVVVSLGGLLSDQLSVGEGRAQVVDDACRDRGIGSIRFNYTAHGWHPDTRSTGDFREVSVTRMIDDAVRVLEHFAPRRVAVVASSIGAGLLPFLLKRVVGTLELGGFFTISAVSADSLRAFVANSLTSDDLERLSSGEDVEIRSPTLPSPIRVNGAQLDDLVAYGDLPPFGLPDARLSNRLLRGSRDGLSTASYNEALAGALGGSPGDVVVLDSEHEVPFQPMLEELVPWLSALNSA